MGEPSAHSIHVGRQRVEIVGCLAPCLSQSLHLVEEEPDLVRRQRRRHRQTSPQRDEVLVGHTTTVEHVFARCRTEPASRR